MADPSHHDFGALVGFTAQAAGDRLTLRLQSVTRAPPHDGKDVHSHFYVMDRNQAAQLANFLFEMSEQTKPGRADRGVLKRLFG